MSNGVCMVGASRFEKLLKVIGLMPRLALEVTLSNGNNLLVRVIGHLVVAALIIAGSHCDSLGSPLWPPLVAFGVPHHALTDCHGAVLLDCRWGPPSRCLG
jgi:hypothetical protein